MTELVSPVELAPVRGGLAGAPRVAAVAVADTAVGAGLPAPVEVLAQAAPLSKAADRLRLASVRGMGLRIV